MHQGYSADTPGVDRGWIVSSLKAGIIFYPIKPNQIKKVISIGRGLSAVRCEGSFITQY